ncbi:complement C1q-like protein 2 [Saccostrea echinata]|uniref:complement C1q-like protein 2 n=1 Tax=Saccostrea echinata TaxID=191078 RepID=UPI002A80C7A7|nr:complement C1q-like protein 2 [Saccostrea echinata]
MVYPLLFLLFCSISDINCLLNKAYPTPPTAASSSNTLDSQFMHQLLLQEQQLRIELQKQITSIQSQIQDLSTNVITCENNYRNLQTKFSDLKANLSTICNQAQVAFFVRLRNKITNHHQSTIIVFDDVQLNKGNAYDENIGTFAAPVDGIYKFDLVLSSDVENGHGEMMHNGVRVLDVYADKHNQRWFGRGSGAIIVLMNKGDKMWIQNTDTGNTVINAGVETAFSGHLLFLP